MMDVVAVLALVLVAVFAYAMMRTERSGRDRQLEAVRGRLRTRARQVRRTTEDGEDPDSGH